MNTAETLRDYFNSLIGHGPNAKFTNAAEMARFLGLKQSTATTFFSFLKGAKTQYAYVIEWLEKVGGRVILPDQSLDGFDLIPRVKAVAGCGESYQIDGDVAGSYAFKHSFFQYLGVNPKNMKAMFVQGDSMQPVINDRDMILFDENETDIREGYIYVLNYDEALMVKRFQRITDGWNICSENPTYSPVPVQGQNMEKLKVYGRVRWFGRVV